MSTIDVATPFRGTVTGPDEARQLPAEYTTAVGKVILSHCRNELAGAELFDEPAIALAEQPNEKYLACRIAMEEYGHHLKFTALARALGLPEQEGARHLSIFDLPMTSWTDFLVVKGLADLAEVVQMEDLLDCTYTPLRDLAAALMPEERFHTSFGQSRLRQAVRTEAGRAEVQASIDRIFPGLPAFFGRSKSTNNELFRRWGVKQRTNDEVRGDWLERSRAFVEGDLGLRLPEVATTYPADN